jgi:heme exporter protein C
MFKPRSFFLGWCLFGVLTLLWLGGILYMPSDQYQGEIYKIIYLHVPSAACAFFAALMLFLASVGSLLKKGPNWAFYGRASAEVGFLFTLITLVTGSVWGKPTWGTWWTWDARLTTTLILGFLYAGYLFLWFGLPLGQSRERLCAALGVLIFFDVPIVYKSVTWWRTLHQPPTLLREGGSAMSPVMLYYLLACLFVSLILCLWLVYQRSQQFALKETLEDGVF